MELLFLAARPGSVAGDIYRPLIDLWDLVQTDPALVVRDYEKQWHCLQEDLPGYYYAVRDRFNKTAAALDLNFLMRTCVNGIVRFNDLGKFNNSFHLSRKGMEPQRFKKTVKIWHEVIQGMQFVCQDYADTVGEAREGDFVYFDPPYAGNKQRYTHDLDLDRFFGILESLNRRQVKWRFRSTGNADRKI